MGRGGEVETSLAVNQKSEIIILYKLPIGWKMSQTFHRSYGIFGFCVLRRTLFISLFTLCVSVEYFRIEFSHTDDFSTFEWFDTICYTHTHYKTYRLFDRSSMSYSNRTGAYSPDMIFDIYFRVIAVFIMSWSAETYAK